MCSSCKDVVFLNWSVTLLEEYLLGLLVVVIVNPLCIIISLDNHDWLLQVVISILLVQDFIDRQIPRISNCTSFDSWLINCGMESRNGSEREAYHAETVEIKVDFLLKTVEGIMGDKSLVVEKIYKVFDLLFSLK